MQEVQDIVRALPTVSPARIERPNSEVGMASSLPAESIIRRLWQRMAEIYGHRWTSAYGDDAGASPGQTWAKGLAGLSPEQIGHGVTAALASADPWPPSLPEFRRLCFGVPTLAAIRHELRPGESTASPFARLVWQYLDGYRYRNADADKSDRLLADAYEMAVDYVMRGGELPEPSVAIAQDEPREHVPARPEVVREHLEKMRDLYGIPESAQ